ncbi:STAS domain-containing protein [Sporosarcina thermotolerans]|uniref:STAS domain-containing protein n=1 Tax=Sporosarcina thermotolerans TaxID=633404 RepID=A0AAW9AA29_9BACL|nr:STAS domain-containing protein [Sporosarcina thermotolerans]MDW0117845.1 STAS domain-containing protein [Sporosarcina thermotolerans]
MIDMNRELYNFLCENTDLITEKWLLDREDLKGSIYSINAGEWAEKLISEQNTLTNLTVASSLLNDCSVFQKNKINWALVITESRVNTNTPIFEVLDALSKLRSTYWFYIEQFVEREGERVLRSDIMGWGITIHKALDELMVEFSKRYDDLMNNRLDAQQSLIEELNAPIIKLNSSIGVLPLIGDVDTTRVQSISDYVPYKCTELDVSNLFIDLSGVSILDTMVANHIYQLTQVLGLLGIESTITGIRPEIAQTSVQLGLDFSKIHTTSSLQLALKTMFKETTI